jgi:malonyl-CoA decarboxylase
VFERLRQARKSGREQASLSQLLTDCSQLLSAKGESNSQAIARRALDRFRALPPDGLLPFFEVLADEYDPDPGEILLLAEDYAVDRSPEKLIRLARAAEPPRQELLRRLNRVPGGTALIVAMRERLLERLRQHKRLKAVDADFEHLLSSWFNPGFLSLVRVDWNSPAALLERIIQHEAVHAIDGWNDLRRRLEPDRRCFAFFHPVMGAEPLIFVEVALEQQMPEAIAPLLSRQAPAAVDPARFRVAVFYSISNCQPGLRGISLGNFLIKRVADELKKEFPQLKTFCTLSPIPGFAGWLAKAESIAREGAAPDRVIRIEQAIEGLRRRNGKDLAGLAAGNAMSDIDAAAIKTVCAWYLLEQTHEPGGDPVARFHLQNGARLERINAGADLSRKGLKQAHGLMVNYLYDLDRIEANHEAFIGGEVSASRAVTGLI